VSKPSNGKERKKKTFEAGEEGQVDPERERQSVSWKKKSDRVLDEKRKEKKRIS